MLNNTFRIISIPEAIIIILVFFNPINKVCGKTSLGIISNKYIINTSALRRNSGLKTMG
jgi:hypothetical protein